MIPGPSGGAVRNRLFLKEWWVSFTKSEKEGIISYNNFLSSNILERRIKPVKNIYFNVISGSMVSVTTTTGGGPPGMTGGS